MARPGCWSPTCIWENLGYHNYLRLVRGPGRGWLDLRGLTCLQLPVPEET
jgi:hypothetical protein